MRKLTVFLVIAGLILSFGIAGAADSSKMPRQYQEQYMAETGTQATVYLWLPMAPVLSSYGWSTYVVISNFIGASNTVSCQFTSYSSEQTTKTYTLPFFGKRIVNVGSEIGTETIFDVYCYSSNQFGLTGLLLEGSAIATSLTAMVL